MATFVINDASIVINAVDLSDHCKSVTLNYEAESVDDTNMGDTTRLMVGGMLNYSLEVEFAQDYAAGEVDATLFALVGTATTVTVKATSGAVSATNPSFSGSMLLTSYSPVSGSIGDLATTSASFVPAGALTRATS